MKISLTKEDPFWLILPEKVDEDSMKYIVLNIYNNGFRPIQISTIYLKGNGGSTIEAVKFLEGQNLPIGLAENEVIDAFFSVGDVISCIRLKKEFLQRAVVKDAIGNEWSLRIPKSIAATIIG